MGISPIKLKWYSDLLDWMNLWKSYEIELSISSWLKKMVRFPPIDNMWSSMKPIGSFERSKEVDYHLLIEFIWLEKESRS